MQQAAKTRTDNLEHFQVALVETAAAPPGAEGDNWCRYVLESGRSALTGWRRGSLQEVTQHATRFTEELNTRSNSHASSWAFGRLKSHRVAESV
jgi:hypothetical protein